MKKTLHLQASSDADVQHAADIVCNGGLVAFPTETVYGLGANALSPDAVGRIFEAKGRPSWDPLIVHVPGRDRVAAVAAVSGELATRVERLAEAFWPGPLTLLLPRTQTIPDAVTAGRPLVGVRVPAHPAALALLRAAGLPLAAPSANRFGHVSPTTAEHVFADLGGRIDAVLDGGPCLVGVESTVLDPGSTPMILYRAGAVTPGLLEQVTGTPVSVYIPPVERAAPDALPSPGVGIRHYAPEAEVILADGNPDALWTAVCAAAASGKRVGVLLPEGWPERTAEGVAVYRWGRWEDSTALGARMFAGLRELEDQRVEVIVCPLPSAGDLGDALRDRLWKAARSQSR